MILTEKQKRRLAGLNIKGKGGKDSLLAFAMEHNRKSARFFDAICENGEKFEYKKQESSQFLDPYKFSQMSAKDKKIKIIFFMHKSGVVEEIYLTTYKTLIETMGYTDKDLKAIARLYERDCFKNRPNTQIKAELKYEEIKTFQKIY